MAATSLSAPIGATPHSAPIGATPHRAPIGATPSPLQAPSPGPAASGAPRRYGRRTAALRVSASLWPDVFACVRSHAEQHQLTLSGAVHDILRRHFKLPIDS